tara:strand:- start:51 stop:1493 length:1443 start_codon:yes stop_codon:yes gene_type:complete
MNNRQLKKKLLEEMAAVHANVELNGRAQQNWVELGNVSLDFDIDTGIWDLDVGSLDLLTDNPHAKQWFNKKYKNIDFNTLNRGRKVKATLEYVDELLDNMPEGATIALKGHAIRSQGSSYSNPTSGAAKNERYIQRWGKQHEFVVLPENAGLLFQKDITKRPLQSKSYPGVRSQYDFEVAKADYRLRKTADPDSKKIKNYYTTGDSEPFFIERRGRGDELKGKAVSLDIDKSGRYRARKRELPQETDPVKVETMKTRAADAALEGKDVDHIRALSLYDEGADIGHVEANTQALELRPHQLKTAEEQRMGRWFGAKELSDPSESLDYATTLRKVGANKLYRGLTSSTSSADSLLQLGGGLATGDVASAAGGAVGLTLQNPAVQRYLAKRLSRMSGKALPGVGLGLSGLEFAGYASQGRYGQAALAGASGVIGEVPLIGDLIAAGLDLTNTTIDLATGNFGGVETDSLEPDSKVLRAVRKIQ